MSEIRFEVRACPWCQWGGWHACTVSHSVVFDVLTWSHWWGALSPFLSSPCLTQPNWRKEKVLLFCIFYLFKSKMFLDMMEKNICCAWEDLLGCLKWVFQPSHLYLHLWGQHLIFKNCCCRCWSVVHHMTTRGRLQKWVNLSSQNKQLLSPDVTSRTTVLGDTFLCFILR